MTQGLTAGGVFGDYRVVRRLGKGGMGEVWLLQSALGGFVAAKILDPATAADHESRKRFLREAEFALGVKHPNLVETYDVGEDPDTGLCYILMEYVPGGTLADHLKANGAMPVDDAVAVVRAMADILELGRQKGIVHRDIKPANIMFAADGTPKLSDLGIARGGIGGGMETTMVTQAGVMIGTPAYMSPEQMLDSHNVDTRADIYSLGVVFFEMLTGERPNRDDTVMQLMAKAVRGETLPDVRTRRPDVPVSIANLLSMMVAPDKESRISAPGQILNVLALIERGGTFEQPEKKHGLLVLFARPKSLLTYVLVLFGLLVALVVAIFALTGKNEPSAQDVQETSLSEHDPTNEVKEVVKKIGKGDFKIKLAGVAVVENTSPSCVESAEFASPGSRLEVFGRVALFRFEYDFPTNYQARICALNWQTADQEGRPVSFLFNNPSLFYRGKGVAEARIVLGEAEGDCELREIHVAITPSPRLEGSERTLLMGPFDVNIRFLLKKQKPIPPPSLPKPIPTINVQDAVDKLFPGWQISDGKLCCVTNGMLWSHVSFSISNDVLVTDEHTALHVRVENFKDNVQRRLRVQIDGRAVRTDEKIAENGVRDVCVRLGKWRGKKIKIEIEDFAIGACTEWLHWSQLEVGDVRRWRFADALDELFPGWRVSDEKQCFVTNGELRTFAPVTIFKEFRVTGKYPALCIHIGNHQDARKCNLHVKVNGNVAYDKAFADGNRDICVRLDKWLGKKVRVEMEHSIKGECQKCVVWSAIAIREIPPPPPPAPPPQPAPPGPFVSQFQGWSVVLGRAYSEDSVNGRRGQVLTQSHVLFSRAVKVPRAIGFPKPRQKLYITVAGESGEKSQLFVKVAGVTVGDRMISSASWKSYEFDLSRWDGQEVFVEVDCAPSGRSWSRVHWQQIKAK